MSPAIVQAHSPEKLPVRAQEGVQECGSLPELRRQSWEPGDDNVARFCRQSISEKRAAQRENSRHLQRAHLKYSAEWLSVHACEKYPSLRKKPPEWNRGNSPTNQRGKPHKTWSIDYSAQKDFCLKARKNEFPAWCCCVLV